MTDKLPRKGEISSFWALKMAWREMRKNRLRLLLFVSSICFGVAAVVVIESLRLNLEDAVAEESKSLLGADLVVSSRQEFDQEDMVQLDSLGGARAKELRFSSMALFPSSGDARLVQVRAQEGTFPFYGEFPTTPSSASQDYQENDYALLDNNLILQMGISLGDSIKVGSRTYEIGGIFEEVPGEAAAASMFSGPRVFLPLRTLDKDLLEKGSRVSRRFRFKFDESTSFSAESAEELREKFPEPQFRVTTVDEAAENLGNALLDLYRFLGIAGLVALLLGSIGIASSIYVYIKRKVPIIATLRCIGLGPDLCSRIFVIQSLIVGVLSSLIGVLAGLALVSSIPAVLQDFIPVAIKSSARPSAVFIAFFAGCAVSVLSSLIPLSQIKKISPMNALRSGVEEGSDIKSSLPYVVLILLLFWGFAVYLTASVARGSGLILGILAVVFVLLIVAQVLIRSLRKLRFRSLSYPIRQGISNLYRPNNQTSTLLVVLGLGTFLIASLTVVQSSLLGRFENIGGEGSPNTLVYDIQEDQADGVRAVMTAGGSEIVDDSPVVTMRMVQINGRSISEIKADSSLGIEDWALSREYRSTFRNNTKSSEKVIEGDWHGVRNEKGNSVSIEASLAEDLKIGLGDQIRFNVQGLDVDVTISSIREVNWFAFESNFFFVFEEGILNDAPKFFILLGKTDSADMPGLQRELVKSFPSVSIVDASAVLIRANDIISKVSLIVRVMALFCIFTGIIVLIASLTMSRFQRFKENALLKTLGAKMSQIRTINSIEYFLLGCLSSLTGLILALIASLLVLRLVFEIPLSIPWSSLGFTFIGIVLLTLFVGFASAFGVSNKSPMEVLRTDTV